MEKHTYIKLQTEDLKGKGLSLFDKAVYSSLLGKYEYHQQPFYTYEKYLADELEISEKTVARSISKLQELRLINIERRYNPETKKVVNYYTVNDACEMNPIGYKEEEKKQDYTQKVIETPAKPIDKDIFKEYVEEHNKTQGIITPLDLKMEKEENIINPEYNKIVVAIKNNFNTEPDIYLANINSLSDIQFSQIETLAQMSHTNPQTTLDFIKEIRNIKSAYAYETL